MKTEAFNALIDEIDPAKKEKDDQGGVPTIEEVREAVKILAAQCGMPRIRNPNKKKIMAFLDHNHFGKSYPGKEVADALLVLIRPHVGEEDLYWIQTFLPLAFKIKARKIKREEEEQSGTH